MTPEQKAKLDALLNADRNAAKGGGNRQRAYDIPDGQNRFRLLPGWRENDPTFFHPFGQHFVPSLNASPDGKDIAAVHVCSWRTFMEGGKRVPCPTCSMVYAADKLDLPEVVKAKLRRARSTQRYLVNALHRNGAEPNKPVMMSLPKTLWEQIFGDSDGNAGLIGMYGYPIDLAEGYDIIITKSGTGLTTKYRADFAPNSQPVPASVLKELVNIDEFVKSNVGSDDVVNRGLSAIRDMAALPAPPTRNNVVNMPHNAQPVVTQARLIQSAPIDQSAIVSAIDTMPASDLNSLLADLEATAVL